MLKAALSRQKGITLVELMIGLAILAIVLTVAVPSAQSIIIRNRIVSEINELSSVVQYARVNAIDEQVDTIICPTTNFTSCTTNWRDPKMVFADYDGNGQRSVDEDILAGTSILNKNNTLAGPANAIRFSPTGSANAQAQLLMCHKDKAAEYARSLTITLQGRVKISQDSNNNGIHEDIDGTQLSCP